MFSNPLFLFGLAGTIIPIAIHLLSRKEGKIIKLGSVRHVVETNTQQFKGIRLNEIILLLLRCALIVVFSLLLSGLQCTHSDGEKWLIVEKGLSGLPDIDSILDSLKKDGYSLHLLDEGFPKLGDSSKSTAEGNYWQLLDELKQEDVSQAIVLSKNNINRFKGLRSTLASNVRWISHPLTETNYPLIAVRLSDDSTLLVTGHSSLYKTYFTTKKTSASSVPTPVTNQDTIKIALVSDDDFTYDQRVIKAILKAIEKSFPIRFILIENDPSKKSVGSADWGIWLSAKRLSGIKVKNVISFQPQESNELILQTEANKWVITRRLNQEVVLLNNLTTQLATMLISEKKFQDKIMAKDRRMVSDSLAWSPSEGSKEIQAAVRYRPADKYLIPLLLVLLMIERIIAYRRNQ